MIKGKAIIELTDKNGSQITYEKNMVTNCFVNFLEMLSNTTNSCPNVNSYNDGLHNLAVNYKTLAINSLDAYGIRIFPVRLVEDANAYATSQPQLGYGDTTINQAPNKGIFNNISSTLLKNLSGDTIGIRLVWDFGTEHCNGEIRSIALTPSNCSGSSSKNLYGKGTVNTGVLFYKDDKRNLITIDKKGNIILVKDNHISFQENKTGISTFEGWKENLDDYVNVNLIGYTDLYKVYDLGDSYLTVAKNTSSNKYELLTLDYTTKSITDTLELTGDFSKYKDFCKCGNHLIFSSYTNNASTPVYYKYKLETGELQEFTEVPNRVSSSAGVNNLMMIKDNVDNQYYCRIAYSRDNYSPYFHRSCNIKEIDGELVVVSSVKSDVREVYSMFANYGVTPIGIIGDTGFTSGSIHLSYLGFDSTTLFTINNLETPITKTEDNTMKITYELTWGE